jgi:hypothetical protein
LAHGARKSSDALAIVVASADNIPFYCDILGHSQSAALQARGTWQ